MLWHNSAWHPRESAQRTVAVAHVHDGVVGVVAQGLAGALVRVVLRHHLPRRHVVVPKPAQPAPHNDENKSLQLHHHTPCGQITNPD
jgi:hypothetical protein